MKLRRLLLLPSDEDERTSDSTLKGEKGPDWDLLAEVDRLRTTSSGLQRGPGDPRPETHRGTGSCGWLSCLGNPPASFF
jgi:hypothetical protein